MKTFLVVWKGHEDDYFHSAVTFSDDFDVENLRLYTWVEMAAQSEGYSEDDLVHLFRYGYDLILICPMPEKFYCGG